MTDSETTSASTPPATVSSVAPIYLGKDEILAAPDGRRFATVKVDEWKPGSVVRISSLSSEMRDLLENVLIKQKKAGTQDNIRAFYVWLCAVDTNGERLFDDVEQVKVLGNKSADPINRIFEASLDLNDVSKQAVEDEAKNSASEGSDTSSSPSR